MKKLGLIIGVAAAAGAAQANPLFTGAYVGGGIGITNIASHASTRTGNTVLSRLELGNNALSGQIHVGASTARDRLYTGVEANVGIGNLAARDLGGRVSYKNNWNYGANARLGALVTPNTALYALAGTSHRSWRYHNSPSNLKKTDTKFTVDVGAGIAFSVRKGVTAGLEVVHGLARSYKYRDTTTAGSPLYTIRPHTTTAMAKVSFVF